MDRADEVKQRGADLKRKLGEFREAQRIKKQKEAASASSGGAGEELLLTASVFDWKAKSVQ